LISWRQALLDLPRLSFDISRMWGICAVVYGWPLADGNGYWGSLSVYNLFTHRLAQYEEPIGVLPAAGVG